MRIAVLTPTGDRHEAFALCYRYITRQHRTPDVWFITDDGATETAVPAGEFPIAKLRLPPMPNSQHRNMLALLDAAENSDCDAFVIVEDDDWYSPHYLARCTEHLRNHELIGEMPARYYNVRTRHWRVFQNTYHASLCQTAFRRSMIQPLRDVVASGQWIDMTFWPKYLSRGLLWDGYNVVGMKSMPGRAGVSNAHRETASWGHADPNLEKLREWIGADAALYAGYVEQASNSDTASNTANSTTKQPIWCASCGMATVTAEGDVCDRCSTAGANSIKCETFLWSGILQYRCPEYPRCRFNCTSLDTMAEHVKGCSAREAASPPPANIGRGLFDADGRKIT